ncbi:hypothetical protein ACT17_19540 [Mycolicibacterium conceptionense]|jgi:hypothetical protein|uniref:ESX-1 secretion-associated protein n=2 Tax=Mycolicibacterium TaxID=1866885 RepID=A0ABR5FWI5_9MYCO|nr:MULTISPECIES: ESX-1 secretion-associated protein [Mycolicibacterium]KLI05161.1 hypothetical protein AA982_26150 [Mycolicibacterium senegalense]KLO52301.1 hypothetical protein ABW05_13030 [Mycolicibacterium senegalense]KMV16614.1 hypothetical protein ACT17_19540 [Mycolicibacterium conceptionense]
MTGGFLGVTSAHVRELSEGQSLADSAISVAAKVTEGVAGSMWLSHGAVCAASNTAVGVAHDARAAACAAMASKSRDLSEKLNIAGSRYDRTDSEAEADIGKEMYPRWV